MTRDIEKELWRERLRIYDARQAKLHAAMDAYDRDVHLPALKALRERCAMEVGHNSDGRWHDNGMGRSWQHCLICGATINETYD